MKTGIKHNILLFCSVLLLFSTTALAQRVCENTKRQVTLKEGIKVYLFKEKSGNRIYFLPTTLQLSQNNGRSEFSYQEYTNDGSASPDGAILHFLVTWGLTKSQNNELKLYAKQYYGENATLGGALYIEATSGLRISNKTEMGKVLNASLKSKGNPPTTSGGKMALSFHIKKEGVKISGEAFKKPAKLSGTTITINYSYVTYTCSGAVNTAKTNTITLTGDMKKWF